jgi:hypothetical protein
VADIEGTNAVVLMCISVPASQNQSYGVSRKPVTIEYSITLPHLKSIQSFSLADLLSR